jgi:hypothetical protein
MADDIEDIIHPLEPSILLNGGKRCRVFSKAEADARDAARPRGDAELSAALARIRGEQPSEQQDDASPDKPEHFKTELEAAKHLKAQADEAAAFEKSVAEGAEYHREELAKREIGRLRSLDDTDRGQLADLQQRERRFAEAAQQLVAADAWARANPQHVTGELRERAVAAAQQLAAERQELDRLQSNGRTNLQNRHAEANRRALFKEIPELADRETRERLVKWAMGKGVSEEMARNTTDRTLVGRAYREMVAEEAAEREKFLNRPRPTHYRSGVLDPRGPVPDRMTIPEAEARLRKTGSDRDAMQLWTMMREQRAERRGKK